MDAKYWILSALVIVGICPQVGNAWEFDCIYDVSPLSYGASPTVYAQASITSTEALVYTNVGIAAAAATSQPPGATMGPTLYVWSIPFNTAMRVQNVFAFPPFSALYQIQAQGQMWYFFNGTVVTYPPTSTDFCAGEGYVVPSP